MQSDVQKPHSFQVHLENSDISAQPLSHARGVDTRSAATQHHYSSGQYSGNAA